jgi:hypothetical protein
MPSNRVPPTFMPGRPLVQPLMTLPSGNVAGSPLV